VGKKRYDKVIAISFKYGQKHGIELIQSQKIAQILHIEQKIVDIIFYKEIIDSALTENGDVNKKHIKNNNLPASFVPNRNALFVLLAHSYAQKRGIKNIITGVNQVDYSGYPDCREPFINKIEKALNMGSEVDIKILTPLLYLNKKDIFKMAEEEEVLDIVLELSHTCYNGVREKHDWGYGCGNCPACKLREKGYLEYKKEKCNV
jgi:7-cyano-7-deazaguanine synthase